MSGRLQPGRVHTGDRKLDDIQRQGERIRAAFNALPFGSGVESDDLEFTATETKVLAHRLGRAPRGFLVTYALGARADLYWTVAPDASTMSLKSDQAGTYRVWVF